MTGRPRYRSTSSGVLRVLSKYSMATARATPRPRPTAMLRPRKSWNLGLAIVVGLGVGVGLAVALEYFDTTVRNPDDVERYLGLPVIGIVPKFEAKR